MLPMAMPRKHEASGEVWGRMMGLYAHALNALSGETICNLDGGGLGMRLVITRRDEDPRDHWKVGMVRLTEDESCHMAKGVVGQGRTKNRWGGGAPRLRRARG